MSRWIARIILALIAAAVLFGLWEIPTTAATGHGPEHMWPIASHHILPIFAVLIAWIVVGCAAVFVSGVIIWILWEAATK